MLSLLLLIGLNFGHAESCYIGSENEMFYVDNFKRALLENTSPLIQEYNLEKQRKRLFDNIKKTNSRRYATLKSPLINGNISDVAQYITKSGAYNKNWISKDHIECSILNVDFVPTRKVLCESADSRPTYSRYIPCVSNEMVDYLHFVTNKAFKCFGKYMNTETRNTLIKKINLESAFGFFFSDKKGRGISQFVSISAYEMSDARHSGHQFLINHVQNNPSDCSGFDEILKENKNTSKTAINTCAYVNIQDGIGRSLIQGFGLYFYYRDIYPRSATRLLANLGISRSNNTYYQRLRKIITLGMYNRGPGAVDESLKANFCTRTDDGNLRCNQSKFRNFYNDPAKYYNMFVAKLENTNFYSYAKAADFQYGKVFSNSGSCKLRRASVRNSKNNLALNP